MHVALLAILLSLALRESSRAGAEHAAAAKRDAPLRLPPAVPVARSARLIGHKPPAKPLVARRVPSPKRLLPSKLLFSFVGLPIEHLPIKDRRIFSSSSHFISLAPHRWSPGVGS
ncbi:hypothetical protein VTN00DRAFT_2706 [Thermoascus crustaceus]|uniref:uncharacterized protein n=1 Tax=Thermoascus crustaceus TaxID=5088 RepID=UPI0037442885